MHMRKHEDTSYLAMDYDNDHACHLPTKDPAHTHASMHTTHKAFYHILYNTFIPEKRIYIFINNSNLGNIIDQAEQILSS